MFRRDIVLAITRLPFCVDIRGEIARKYAAIYNRVRAIIDLPLKISWESARAMWVDTLAHQMLASAEVMCQISIVRDLLLNGDYGEIDTETLQLRVCVVNESRAHTDVVVTIKFTARWYDVIYYRTTRGQLFVGTFTLPRELCYA